MARSRHLSLTAPGFFGRGLVALLFGCAGCAVDHYQHFASDTKPVELIPAYRPGQAEPVSQVSPAPAAVALPSTPKEPLPQSPSLPSSSFGVPAPDSGLYVESDRFASIEVATLFPHLSSTLTAPVQLGTMGPTTILALPNAHLNVTASPVIQLGALRFGPGYGELAFSYRFLVTEGKDLVPALDESGAGVIRSRLNLQTFSIDYIQNDYGLRWETFLSWEVGARLQVVFFDTQAETAASFEQARNYFFGAGPHAGFTVTRALAHELGLFGRFDAAMLGGYNTAQNFVVARRDPQNGILSGTASQQESQFSPSLAVQVGFSWSPNWLPSSDVRGGYQFEQWYNLGRVEASRGDLNAHGFFISWQGNF